jgi:hypothetical protein
MKNVMKNDDIDLIENHFNINITAYTHNVPELLQIDGRNTSN